MKTAFQAVFFVIEVACVWWIVQAALAHGLGTTTSEMLTFIFCFAGALAMARLGEWVKYQD